MLFGSDLDWIPDLKDCCHRGACEKQSGSLAEITVVAAQLKVLLFYWTIKVQGLTSKLITWGESSSPNFYYNQLQFITIYSDSI